MPTVLFLSGWRFFFYADERNEPVHTHARKAEMDCRYWLEVDTFEIREAFSYSMAPKDYREVRRIIFEHFDQIVAEWQRFHGGDR